jgi:TonB family protein
MRNAILLLVCLTASAVAQQEPTLTWLHESYPTYPQMARIAHITGRVILEVTVQPSGEFTVSRAIGHPILVQAAKDSIQGAKLRCEGCGDEQHTFSIAYEFKMDNPPPPSPPVAAVPSVRRQRDRSIRCLYLWRCGSIWFY